MLSKDKVLLSNPLFCKKMHGGRNRAFLIIPSFLILFFAHSNLSHSQFLQANPDSIPFAPAVNYGAGDRAYSVFCADLDGDGDLDLAVANVGTNYIGSISILKNNGDGTFQNRVDYATGLYSSSVFCANLDGDSDLDLAVVNEESDNVSILKNNGNGTFEPAVNYGVGDHPVSVFCADLDGDNALDLAVANIFTDSISILLNNGDGTFQPAVNYEAGNGPFSVFCGDLDKDSDPDLAVGNVYPPRYVSILKNNGDGTFQTKVDYPAGDGAFSVFCADLDGDLDLDLAVANAYSDSVSVLKNNGDGTFQPPLQCETGEAPSAVFCADLDGDIDLDLAVGYLGTHHVSVFRNNGDGTFQPAGNYQVGVGVPVSVFCADLDADGDQDLAVSNNNTNISIFLNLSNSRPYAYSLLSPLNDDSVKLPVTFNWQASIDPDPIDTVRYDLYLSRSIVFNPDSTIVHVSLLDTAFTDSLGPGSWYWKVKAYDKWGAVLWSNETWSFWVLSPPDPYSLISPPDSEFVLMPVTFNWQTSPDVDPNDTVRYDLYLSRNDAFNPYTVYANLLDTFLIDSLDIKLWYWKVKAYDKWGAERWSNQTWSFYVFLCGDCNGDGLVELGDVVCLITYLYKNGTAPIPLLAEDCNCSGEVELGDVVYLISYLYKSGDEPCLNCK
jgi:hypothetical protein